MWILLNHFRDEEEEFEKTKLLCRFMNPVAAAEVFDNKQIVRTESTQDMLFDQIPESLKKKYTPEELAAIMADPEHYASLDRIEKA